jgi:hypothetical protein
MFVCMMCTTSSSFSMNLYAYLLEYSCMAFVCIVCILASRIMHNSLYNMMCILILVLLLESYSRI